MKIKIILFVMLLLIVPSLASSDTFQDIRNKSTYWMPYKIQGTNTIVVLNKKMEKLDSNQEIMVCDAIKHCQWDKDKRTGKYFWFELGNLEGIVSKNFTALSSIKYTADLNEIMIDIKKQLNKPWKSGLGVYW